MLTTAWAIAGTFTWLGMVLAISFVEAPLKFQAPGVTVQIGLGIGRLVFRVLNVVEAVFAAVILVAVLVDGPPVPVMVATLTAVAVLLTQLALVRPMLNRRTKAVLAGEDAPRSRSHYAYIVLETVKVAALVVGGVVMVAVP